MTNSGGWAVPQHYSTVRCVEFRNVVFVVARGTNELHLAAFCAEANEWKMLPHFEAFGDGEGCNQPESYRTFRATVLEESLWTFIRTSAGTLLASYKVDKNKWKRFSMLNWLTASQGFSSPSFYETIQFLSVDHRLCIVVRTPAGLQLAFFFPREKRLELASLLPLFSDADGGHYPECYKSIRAHAVGRKVYVCGFANRELALAYFDTETERWNLLAGNPLFFPNSGNENYFATASAPQRSWRQCLQFLQPQEKQVGKDFT